MLMIALFVIFVISSITIPISMALWFFSRRKITEPWLDKKVARLLSKIVLIVWCLIVLLSMALNNLYSLDNLIPYYFILSQVFIFTPAVVALFGVTFAKKRVIKSYQREPDAYDSLEQAVRLQHQDVELELPTEVKPDRLSNYLLALFFIALTLSATYPIHQADWLAAISAVMLLFTVLVYFIWRLLRPDDY